MLVLGEEMLEDAELLGLESEGAFLGRVAGIESAIELCILGPPVEDRGSHGLSFATELQLLVVLERKWLEVELEVELLIVLLL
jgi:hypothetical protein